MNYGNVRAETAQHVGRRPILRIYRLVVGESAGPNCAADRASTETACLPPRDGESGPKLRSTPRPILRIYRLVAGWATVT
jgi:hypothetical protein